MKPEDYTHRIGRTGRAGRSGIAITIALHSERVKIRGIERFTQNSLTPSIIPGLEPQKKAESGSSRPGGRSGGGRSDRRDGGRNRGPNRSNSSGHGFSNKDSQTTSFSAPKPRQFSETPNSSFSAPKPRQFSETPNPTSSEPKENRYGKGQRSEAKKFSPKTESFSKSPSKPIGDFPAKPKVRSNTSEQRFSKPKEGFGGRDKSTKTFSKTSFKSR